MWAVLLPTKGPTVDAIKQVQAVAEESGCKLRVRVLRTDIGGEFTATEFAAYCVDEGIQHHFSPPYSPQQNGVVKRHNGRYRSGEACGMPAKFWGEAVTTALHLLNRSPTKSLQGKTPYEAWHRRTPAVGHLWTFGCIAYVKELNQLGKLDDRCKADVMYVEDAKAYCILDPMSRDVVFDEGRGWD